MKKIYLSFLNMFDLARRVFKLRIIHDCYHFYILKYLEKQYSHIIEKYSKLSIENGELDNKTKEINNNAWAMWWQGEELAPPIVKICLKNSKEIFKNLIVIDKNNFTNYISLPEHIINKFENGEISMACFSDIIRFNLLSEYGGTWLDATIYLKDFTKEKELKNPYTSLKGTDYSKGKYVPKGKWRGFFQYGEKDLLIFQFAKEFFYEYWKYENRLINFFLIDYILEIAYRNNIGNFKIIINSMSQMSNEVYELDRQLFSSSPIKINFSNSHVFKLNTKHNYPMEVNGKDSNYKKFLEGTLF